MKLFKKSVCLLIALILMLSAVPFAFVKGADEKITNALELEIKTNKTVYKTTSTAKITVTVRNKSTATLYDVTAQAIFNDLVPVKEKTNITTKSIDYLNPGDDFSIAYNAILNSDNFDVGFFRKGVFFFAGLFRKPYFIDSSDLSGKNVSLEKFTSEITFGKFTAENVVEVAFSTTEPYSDFTMPEEPTTTEAATATTTTAPAVNVQINNIAPAPPTTKHNPPRTTRPQPTEPRTTRPYREQKTTRPYTEPVRPTEPMTTTEAYRPTENNSLEARAYRKYISFLEENIGSIGNCDGADIDGNGLIDLLIENYNGNVAVFTYNEQFGIYELYSAPKGKGYNMEVYYDLDSHELISPSGSTGDITYKTVKISYSGSTVTSELIRYNGKFDEGCFLDGQQITEDEYNRIVDSYPNEYYNIDGSASQLIRILEEEL